MYDSKTMACIPEQLESISPISNYFYRNKQSMTHV